MNKKELEEFSANDNNFPELGFMPRNDGGIFTSRDHALRVSCKDKTCYLNENGNSCTMPTAMNLNNKHECMGYKNKRNLQKIK